MTDYNWLIHTIGICSIIYSFSAILNIIDLLNSFAVKYAGATVKIYTRTWVSFLMTISYFSWLFFG